MRHRQDVADVLEHAPQAFMGMLAGRDFGKALVRFAGSQEVLRRSTSDAVRPG